MWKTSFLKDKLPIQVRLFFGKALLFFIIWKIAYTFFLFDSQIVDSFLTEHIGNTSAFVLNNSGFLSGFTSIIEKYDEVYDGGILHNRISAIYHNNYKVLHIANACNGLELIVLYIGFIVCMPSSFVRKIKYIILGIIALDLINVIRIVGLIYLREYFEAYFNFAHHFLFKAVIYLSTFIMWRFFSRKIDFNKYIVSQKTESLH